MLNDRQLNFDAVFAVVCVWRIYRVFGFYYFSCEVCVDLDVTEWCIPSAFCIDRGEVSGVGVGSTENYEGVDVGGFLFYCV